MKPIPLPLHSYRLRSHPASSARLLNCYAAENPPDAKTPVRLVRTPGVPLWNTVGNGPIWAVFKALGYLWVVSGSKLYRISASFVITLIGDIGPVLSIQSIDIDANDQSVVVVNTPNAYYFDGSTFGQIVDPDFLARGAADVEFVDDYLLFRQPNSGTFFGADLGSPNSFDPLNFATAEGAPDNLVGLKTDHRQVVLPGEDTIEIWEDVGGSGFPFQRAANGFLEIGCANGRTMKKFDNSIAWVANDYTVRRLDGLTPVVISQDAVTQFLSTATLSQANAWSYSQDGHIFYVLTVPEGTWTYDAATKEWHERSTYGFNYWTLGTHAQAFGKEWVGDSTNNGLGYLDPANYTYFAATHRMEWTYQTVYAQGQRAFHDRLEVGIETGVGLATGQGSDPKIMLEGSDDGGISWYPFPNRSMGKLGETQTRVFWTNLGSAYQRTYRMAVSDPVRVTVTDTQLTVRGARRIERADSAA